MFGIRVWSRQMARRATSKFNSPNLEGRTTVYKPEEWEPPTKEVFTTQTPEKRPMRWPIDFRIPRTSGRENKGQRDIILRFHAYGCKNRSVFHLVVAKVICFVL